MVAILGNANAAGLAVKPTKLFFTPGSETSALTLTNQGDREISVQVSARAWSQGPDGADSYEPTTDLVVFPKILRIAPGAERIVRVGYQGAPVGAEEQAYRVYAQELPVEEPGVEAMKFVIRIGVPVFARAEFHETQWTFDGARFSPAGLQLRVTNKGGQHVMVERISAAGLDAAGSQTFVIEDAGWYVHAGNARGFNLPLTPEQCASASTVRLQATVADSTVERVMNVEAGDCTSLPARTNPPRLAR